MEYRIKYREYDEHDDDQDGLVEFLSAVNAWFFEIENGFVSIWTERNKTQIPDFYINANDVLTIEPL